MTLLDTGAETVLLACTELGMLTEQNPDGLAIMDTAHEHAEAAWRRAVPR